MGLNHFCMADYLQYTVTLVRLEWLEAIEKFHWPAIIMTVTRLSSQWNWRSISLVTKFMNSKGVVCNLILSIVMMPGIVYVLMYLQLSFTKLLVDFTQFLFTSLRIFVCR